MMLSPVIAVLMMNSAGAAPACRVIVRPASTGDVIEAKDTMPGPCPQAKGARKLRYDPVAKVARAAVDLAPGDDLGNVYLPKRPSILPGDRVAVVARLGPVQLSREVTALQSGHSGQWLFVRDDAGKVFKVPIPSAENEQ
jgi:hypothetical protein